MRHCLSVILQGIFCKDPIIHIALSRLDAKLGRIDPDIRMDSQERSESRFEACRYLLLLITSTCLFIGQSFAQTLTRDPSELDARQLAQEHVTSFLAELPMEGRVEWYGIYDESESYRGPSRKIGWGSFKIRVDNNASQVIVVWESVRSGTYYGKPCKRRSLTTHCFNAKAPWNPLSTTYHYIETRSNEIPLQRIEERQYLGDVVNIRYEEAGESRSVTLQAGRYSLVDEILVDLLATLNAKSSLTAACYEEPAEGMQYDHTTMKVDPTDAGWEILETTLDGTFSLRANAGKDGSILFEERPFKEFLRREDEFTSNSNTGKYQFPEYLDFSISGEEVIPELPLVVEYAILGDWRSLITSSDIQSVTYNGTQNQTLVSVHPFDRKQILEAPNDRTQYLTNAPHVPKRIEAIASDIIKSARSEPERLHAILSWLYRRIRYQNNYDPPSDIEVVLELKGDCSEFSSLMVQLCRSSGIPARDITGLYGYASGKMGLHGWVEVLIDGRWISIDPTAGELVPGPEHIRLTYEYRNDALAMSQFESFCEEIPTINVQRAVRGDDAWKSLYSRLLADKPHEALWSCKLAEIVSDETEIALGHLATALEIDPLFHKAWKQRAHLYVKARDDVNAFRCFGKALELNPFDEDVAIGIASAYSRMGDQLKAITALCDAILKHPASGRLLSHRGSLYENLGEHEKSLADFREAFKISPDSGPDAFFVAMQLIRMGQLDEADKFLQEAENTVTQDRDSILFCKNKILLKRGMYEDIVKISLQALAIEPEDSSNITLPAESIFDAGHEVLGIQLLTAAIELRPDDSKLLLARGRLFKSQNAFDSAIEDLQAAMKTRPADAEILEEAIDVLNRMGRLEDAAVLLANGLQIADDKAEIHFGEACRLFGRHDFQMAENHLILARAEKPDIAKYILKQSEVMFDAQKVEDAIQLLEAASGTPSYDDTAIMLNNAALLLDRQGRLVESAAYYARAACAAPSKPSYVVNYARTLVELGRVDDAIQVLNDALPLVIDCDQLYFARGEFFGSQQDFRKASDDFRKACRHNSNRSKYLTALADSLANAGDVSAAIEAFSEALVFHLQDTSIINARGILYFKNAQWSEAAADFRRAAELKPSVIVYVKNAVAAYCELKAYDEALSLLDANVSATCKSPELLELRADVNLVAEEFQSAEMNYRAAIAAAASDVNLDNLNFGLGKALWKQEKFEAAHDAFDSSLRVNSSEPTTAIPIGDWLSLNHEYAFALEYYQKANERSPGSTAICLSIATTQMLMQELVQAEDSLTAAIEKCTDKYPLFSKRAEVRELLNEWENAKLDLNNSIPPNCDRPELLSAAAEIYAKRNEFRLANTFICHAIGLEPKNRNYHRDRILCSIGGELDQAEEYVREAIQQASESDDANFIDHVAWSAAVSSSNSFPWRALQKAVAEIAGANAENAAFLESLGAVEYRAGDYGSAVKNLRKSLEVSGYDLSRLLTRQESTEKNLAPESDDEIGSRCFCLGFFALASLASGDLTTARNAKVDFEIANSTLPTADWREAIRRNLIKQQLDKSGL